MPDDPQPWYRTSGAVFTAGGVGLVLVIALVITIVQMSDQWSTPASTFMPPPVATTTATTPASVTTPAPTTATTYPTVSLSTTDINPSITPPSGSETSTSGTSTSGTSTPGTSTPGTSPPETTAATAETEDDEPITRTPRRTPRTNITRTLIPRPIN